jgi:hypothetical protein
MMRPLFLTALLVISACAAQTPSAGGAEASAQGPRDCFLSSQVRGFNPIDRNHIRISVGASDEYILTTNWNAYDLQYAEHIALRSTTGSICTGNGLGVDIIGGRNHQRYPVSDIARAPEAAPAASQGS